MSDNYFDSVYSEKDRTNIVVYRSVKFQKLDIGIPRCKNCKKIHRNSSVLAFVISFMMAVGVVLFVNYYFRYDIVYRIFLSIIGFLLTFILPSYFIAKMLTSRQGILSEIEGMENEPQVQQLQLQGWTLSRPSA